MLTARGDPNDFCLHAFVKSKRDGRNCLGIGSGTLQTCIVSRIMTDYYFKFPSNFQEILINQEHPLTKPLALYMKVKATDFDGT